MFSDMDEPSSDCMSDALSELSRSPSPPPGMLPTPPYSHGSPAPTPSPSPNASMTEDDGAPPAKRRRLSPSTSMPRETRRLDLNERLLEEQPDEHEQLVKALKNKRKIVVVAGAGISVNAGIPDFRSATGLFNSLKSQYNLKGDGKQLFDASVYNDANSTASFHEMIRNLHNSTRNVEPTRFHDLVARLATEGRLLRLYTQNVDGIDTSIPPLATQIPLPLKGPWPKTVQLHGGLDKMTCTKCHEIKDFEPELFDGPIPPECGSCKERDETREAVGKRSHGIGRLRPRMVLYHEHNPDDEAIGAVTAADLRTRPDAVIVVGTTLKVPGVRRIVREMCNVVRDRRDGFTVWINNDPKPTGREFEDSWDMIVQGTSDGVARLANLPGWNEPDVAVALTPEEVQQISSSQTVAVALPPTPRQTPATTRQASPSKMQVLPSIEMEQWRTQAKKESTSSRSTSKTKKSKAVKLAKASVQQKKPTTKATSAKRAAAKPNAKLNFPVTKPVKAPPQQKRKPSDPTDKKEPLSPSAKSNALPPPIKITLKLTTKGLETEGSRKRTIEA